MGKLLLPRCDQCQAAWRPRYRRGKAPQFYCPRCSRKHPVWTHAEIEAAVAEARRITTLANWM